MYVYSEMKSRPMGHLRDMRKGREREGTRREARRRAAENVISLSRLLAFSASLSPYFWDLGGNFTLSDDYV